MSLYIGDSLVHRLGWNIQTDNWPINKDKLIKKHYKTLAKFTKQMDKIKEINA